MSDQGPDITPALPVFVLGIQRSGTTRVANLICSHPDVVGVEAADHQGVHESIFFSHFARAYGDISGTEEFERFARDFVSCDYFLLTGLDPDWFVHRRARGYAEAFRSLMDEFARRQGAAAWLEKSPHHTLLSAELAAAYPDARFVCVTRDAAPLVRSRLWAYGRQPPGPPRRWILIARACAGISLYQRHLRRFCAECDRAIDIRYEDLMMRFDETTRRLTDFLALDDVSALVDRFPANTSFRSEEEREQGLSRLDIMLVRLFTALLALVPLRLLKRLARRSDAARDDSWPSWCWKRQPRPAELPTPRASLHGSLAAERSSA